MKVWIFLLSGSEPVQSDAVVLENMPDNMSIEMLSMLVENTLVLDESSYSLEILWESSRTVVTFNNPTGRKQHKLHPLKQLNTLNQNEPCLRLES